MTTEALKYLPQMGLDPSRWSAVWGQSVTETIRVAGGTRHALAVRLVKPPRAIITIQHTKLGLADANSILKHSLEHRLQLARRGGDDLQHLGGRGLLLNHSRR
jgi:hypothetical protein